MVWQIEVSDAAKKHLAKMGRVEAKRITAFLRQRVSSLEDPRQLGGPLHGSHFAGLWRHRVGDYRILVEIQDGKLIVLVVGIGHRGEAYRQT